MISIATFSIVAFDPRRQEWGVAVQSKFLAVGAVVSWAQAGAGAIATQAYGNFTYGPNGLQLLASGMNAGDVIRTLTAADEKRALRQLGVVDAQGRAAAFTGDDCDEWAGHIIGDGYTCLGNILVPGTVEAMAHRYEARRHGGTGELADWLVDALQAGQKAGGDRRGRQSAAVLVVRENGGFGGNNDRYLDLRVDDHPQPIHELQRLLQLHHNMFNPSNTSLRERHDA